MTEAVDAEYFDGRSTRVHPVGLSLAVDRLIVAGPDVDLSIPFEFVTVDERLGNSPRRLRLPGGAFCVVRDLSGLDRLLAAAGHRDRPVDRLQRRLNVAIAAGLVCLLMASAAYLWGLPWIAAVGAQHVPASVGKALTNNALKVLDGHFLQPSELPDQRRDAVHARFLALRLPEGGTPRSALLFRKSPPLGANAFTLPDGTIVLLDDLVDCIGDDDQIIAVLAHELGHAHGRHGLQLLIQSSAVGAFWTFYIGDVSQLFAAAPTLLMQAKFSRGLEAQADDYGAALLAENGLPPSLLADALEKLAARRGKSDEIPFLASHPSTNDRIEGLRHRTR